MPRTICILQGHPHHTVRHYDHALADAYAEGAEAAGATVHRIDAGALAVPPMVDPADLGIASDDPAILAAQATIREADHLVIVFPLWFGTMPAQLKAFLEQLARGAFLIGDTDTGGWPEQKLRGRSARVIVTMGMPAIAYRVWFLNAGVSSLNRLILGLSGMRPVRQTTIGSVGALDDKGRAKWLDRVRALGRRFA